jgi:hypothetical protein
MQTTQLHFSRALRLGAAIAVVLLQACVFTPRTVHFDDPNCQGSRRETVLDSRVVEGYKACADGPCRADALLGAIGSAATLVVSGSIYVVGNVAYWLERQVNCKPP